MSFTRLLGGLTAAEELLEELCHFTAVVIEARS